MKISPDERHTQILGSITETVQRSQISFIDQKKVNVCEHMAIKTSVIVLMVQLSFRVPFIWRSLHFFGMSFLFLFL